MEKEIIMYDSPEAAQIKTLIGWVSKDGRFFGKDEHMARWAGCTHRNCEVCGKPHSKTYTKCEECIAKADRERYYALPFKEWDGVQPIYSDSLDKYFFSESDVLEYMEQEEIDDDCDLRLLLCEKNHFFSVDADIWSDILPEDGEIPDELEIKLKEFNDFIMTLPPASYSPGKIRTALQQFLPK